MRSSKSLWMAMALVSACGSESSQPQPQPQPREQSPQEVFEALPTELGINHDKMVLGRALYFDRRLSGDETLSCATCHEMDHGGAEARPTSTGIRGQTGPINAPTVLNSVYNFRQFWNGRAADLLEQAAGPVTNPIEMGGDWAVIMPRLQADAALVEQMSHVYGENGLTREHVLDAIVEYERSLVTPSRFDRYLRGETSALNEQEVRGMRRFMSVGCTTCHNGRNIGGNSYQKLGLVRDYFAARGGEITEADLGRFAVTHQEADRHQFKVPTLRNVELTAPYFHDASRATLADAVRAMAAFQLGQDLGDADVNDIVAFLRSLTGELPAEARMPAAPASPPPTPTEEAAPPAEGTAPAPTNPPVPAVPS
jgi:cytochrome c peroxidase